MRHNNKRTDRNLNPNDNLISSDSSPRPETFSNRFRYWQDSEPDNTSIPSYEDQKHLGSSFRMNTEPLRLTDLWAQHTLITYHVLLLVEPEKVQNIIKTQWHWSQNVTIRPDGYATIEFHVQNITALRGWLTQHSPIIQIIHAVSS